VVEKSGEIKLGLSECSGCHTRLMPDGSVLRGAQGNLEGGGVALRALLDNFAVALGTGGKPVTPAEMAYLSYGVPWLAGDIHLGFKSMTAKELEPILGAFIGGTVARFDGSPYYTTKIPDLIGIKDRRYLDHTGTHLNRGPADVARYAILVSGEAEGSFGNYEMLTPEQRKLPYRFPDEMMFALAKFLYALEPPPNPNKYDALAARGETVFRKSGCTMCHTPPVYTNNMLIPADGFEHPRDDPARSLLRVMEGVRIGTDPGLALKTRKGTGYYKVPSLRGLWYRGLIEHSGSIAALEDWFDRKRLSDEYVPSGWKGPGVQKRAVKGHEIGLDLDAEDKRALIAFLKTL
jgi:hypothetical protein